MEDEANPLLYRAHYQDCMGRLREGATMQTVPAPALGGLHFHHEDGGHSFLRRVQATRCHISEDSSYFQRKCELFPKNVAAIPAD